VSALAGGYWENIPLGRDVVVLVRDEQGLIALNKPAGVLSHPNAPGEEARSLLNAPYAMEGEYFEWTPPGATGVQRLWLLNRLDSATSGVILAATNEALATQVRAQFKRKQVRKTYRALVFGKPRQPMELWRDVLAVEKRGGHVRTVTHAGHVPAESRMTVLRSNHTEPKLTLVKLEPRTGRTHQLRVQCAKRGLPIVGDQTYGDFARNREFAKASNTKRLFLHSFETAFTYEFNGRQHSFSANAALPPEFEKYL
jgi:tRNA pseudouridine65 synthase